MNGKIRSCTYGNVNDPDMELRVDITDPLNSIYDIFDRSVSILIQYFPNNMIAEGSDSGISSGREKSASRKNSGYMGSVSTIVDERGEMRERKKNFFGRNSGTGKIPERKDTTFKIRMRRNSGIKNSNSDILSEKFVFLCVRTPVVNGLFYPFHEGKAFVFSLLYA